MKIENTFDPDKLMQIMMSIQNASMITVMFVKVQESLNKLSILLELISGSMGLKEAVPAIRSKAKLFEEMIPNFNLLAAMSIQTVNVGRKLLSESFLLPEWNDKAKHYIHRSIIDNYGLVMAIAPYIHILDNIDQQLNAILFTTRYEIEIADSDEQKKKAVIVVNSIAETKAQINYLHEAFNEMLGNYYY